MYSEVSKENPPQLKIHLGFLPAATLQNGQLTYARPRIALYRASGRHAILLSTYAFGRVSGSVLASEPGDQALMLAIHP